MSPLSCGLYKFTSRTGPVALIVCERLGRLFAHGKGVFQSRTGALMLRTHGLLKAFERLTGEGRSDQPFGR